VLLTLLLVGGQRVMRWWLTLVARRKSEELFMLNLLLVTLGLAWLTEHAGLSLALGAFVAGMLVAETEYKHQVETDIRPFHDVLLGLFFITIGMKLDWRPVLDQWLLVLLLTTLPGAGQVRLVAALARLFRAAPGVALRTGLYLAQAGEFGFVLLTLGADSGLVAPQWMSPVLASMVLSMLATPFIVMYSDRIVMRLSASDWLLQSVQLTTIAKKVDRAPRSTSSSAATAAAARTWRAAGHAAHPLHGAGPRPRPRAPGRRRRPERGLRRRRAAAEPDGRRPGARQRGGGELPRHAVGAEDPAPGARTCAGKVPVIVRTIDDADLETLRAAGATEVVPEAIEGSLMLASHALALVGVPMRKVIRITRDARDARYGLLRGYFHGADDDTVEELAQARLQSVTLPEGALASGQPLDDLALHAVGVHRGVGAARRGGGAAARPAACAGRRRHAGAVGPARGAGAGRSQAAEGLMQHRAGRALAGAYRRAMNRRVQREPTATPRPTSAAHPHRARLAGAGRAVPRHHAAAEPTRGCSAC
jgi:CPA2 family monovalent cation:H+ antiporter-2